MTEFELYPVERHWWTFSDYRAVVDQVRRFQPASVLEFGPGSSTLALIEGGAGHVDTCEDNPDWRAVYDERLVRRFPGRVTMRPYVWGKPLSIPGADARRYDFALIDGPLAPRLRHVALEYALARTAVVMMPTEEGRYGIPAAITRLAAKAGRPVEWLETGPLAGGFAVIGPASGEAVD